MEKKQIFSLVAIIGAILLIVATFLTWVDFNYFVDTESFSGLGLVTGDDADLFQDNDIDSYQKYAGIVALVMGILAALIEVLVLLKPAFTKYGAIVAAVLGLVALIYSALFFTWNIFTDDTYSELFSAQSGVYVAIVGAVILLVMAAVQVYEGSKKVSAA